MKLRTRLIVTLIAIVLLVAGPALYALSRLNALRAIAESQRSRHAEAYLRVGEARTNLAELDRFTRSYIIDGDPQLRAAMQNALGLSRVNANQLSELGYPNATVAVKRSINKLDAATDTIVMLMDANRRDEASVYFDRVKPVLAQAQGQDLDKVAVRIDSLSAREMVRAQHISSRAAATTLAALVICTLIAIGFGLWSASTITKPITQLRRSTARVAEGDFMVPEHLPLNRQDEIGDLSRSFSWMTQQLRRLDQMKAEFISIATHELKTPINVVSGYAELLEEGIYGNPTPRQREALETIREQTRILTNLVNQLLDVSRFEAGGLQLEMQDVELRELFARVERSFSVLARKKNIDFRVDVEENVPRYIRADADRLGDQVIGNLLSNALKFTAEGGSIRMRCWPQPDGVHIEVQDTGVGVAPDQLPYIFDKYFQVGQQARSTGAGLGLAIAREIVEAHGGWITAESQPGEGTTFMFVLPARIASDSTRSLVEKSA
jgi:signal transduction histidine kinase